MNYELRTTSRARLYMQIYNQPYIRSGFQISKPMSGVANTIERVGILLDIGNPLGNKMESLFYKLEIETVNWEK